MPPYLTPEQAHVRLSAYEIDGFPTDGALRVASLHLDTLGPFKGVRYSSTQEHAFPRSYTLDGDTENVVPDAVLDWVALEAMKFTPGPTGAVGDRPPVSSISHAQAGSVTYARPKISTEALLQQGLLTRYQRKSGQAL